VEVLMRKLLADAIVKTIKLTIFEEDYFALNTGAQIDMGGGGEDGFSISIGANNPWTHVAISMHLPVVTGPDQEFFNIAYAKLNRHHDVDDEWDVKFGVNVCLVRCARGLIDQYLDLVQYQLNQLKKELAILKEIVDGGTSTGETWARLIYLGNAIEAYSLFLDSGFNDEMKKQMNLGDEEE